MNSFVLDTIIKRIEIEEKRDIEKDSAEESYIKFLDSKFKHLTPKIVDYKTSKTDSRISTIRHGFNILARKKQWEKLKRNIIKEKDHCNIDNDSFVDIFASFLTAISTDNVIKQIQSSFQLLDIPKEFKEDCNDIITAPKI